MTDITINEQLRRAFQSVTGGDYTTSSLSSVPTQMARQRPPLSRSRPTSPRTIASRRALPRDHATLAAG